MSRPSTSRETGRIGPNAIIRMVEALDALEGKAGVARVLAAAGLERYTDGLPSRMIDEDEVTALMRATSECLGADRGRTVGWVAGQRTGDYLLAHRIPGSAQSLLTAAPAWLSSRLLLAAIARHTWTFAGTGIVRFTPGNPIRIAIHNSPLCRLRQCGEPCCTYYAATFERLFRALVVADARCVETACAATGADHCTFEIAWPRLRLPGRRRLAPDQGARMTPHVMSRPTA